MSRPSRAIPRPVWPHGPVTYILLTLLFLQTVICLTPPGKLPSPIRHLQALALTVFHTRAALKLFLLFTLSVHLLEALYALSLLRRVARSLDRRALLWALQTALVGFPSLLLLMEKLARSPD